MGIGYIKLNAVGRSQIGVSFHEILPDKVYELVALDEDETAIVTSERSYLQCIRDEHYDLVTIDGRPFYAPTSDAMRYKMLLRWVYSAAVNGEPIDPTIESEIRDVLGYNGHGDLFATEG